MGSKIINSQFYRQFNVWKKINNQTIVVFRCFEILETNMFCVQSSDYFYDPIDDEQLRKSYKQNLQLFIEEMPDVRSETFLSIEEAIAHHIKDFDD